MIPASDEIYPDAVRRFSQERAPYGVVLMSLGLHPLLLDARAAELCEEITQVEGGTTGSLPLSVMKLCGAIKELLPLRNHAKDWEEFQLKRVIKSGKRHILACGIGLPATASGNESSILITLSIIAARTFPSLQQTQQRFRLTDREIDVISCLLRGSTNKEIGNNLGITEQTAKEHIKHIMEKTSTTTRTGILCAISGF